MTLAFFAEAIKWGMNNPELGWIVVGIYLMVELRSRHGVVSNMNKMVLSVITVIRALARVHDDIDTEEVDDYLLENGTQPDDFIDDVEEDQDEEVPLKNNR